jgi:ABC-type branched-subunit amino acid transport system substrate-binding protein
VGVGAHTFGEADYSTHIVRILETKPDVVVSEQWAGDALNFIKQANPTGFFDKIKMFRLNCASTSAIVSLKDKMPGVYAATEQGQPYMPKMKKWRDAYYDYLGEWPVTECAPAYYDAVFMYKQAVEKAKTTKSDEVAAALEGLDYVGPSGKRRIRKDHQADCDYITLGKLVPSKEFEWKVWGEMANVPYDKVKFTNEELVALGCEFCKGRGE